MIRIRNRYSKGEVAVLKQLWLDCKFIYASLYVKLSQILASMRADILVEGSYAAEGYVPGQANIGGLYTLATLERKGGLYVFVGVAAIRFPVLKCAHAQSK